MLTQGLPWLDEVQAEYLKFAGRIRANEFADFEIAQREFRKLETALFTERRPTSVPTTKRS
jgi:hypothetical protein